MQARKVECEHRPVVSTFRLRREGSSLILEKRVLILRGIWIDLCGCAGLNRAHAKILPYNIRGAALCD